jgi:hypothetical protein
MSAPATTSTAPPPVSFDTLKTIATDVCQRVVGNVQCYDHAKVEEWNTKIINYMLNDVVAEAPKIANAKQPVHKFACNSTIVQHLVPTAQLNKPRPSSGEPQVSTSADDNDAATTATDGKPHVGRRGMHSATGAYWDSAKDGMWTFKYDGEGKGMDVVIMLIWIAYQ